MALLILSTYPFVVYHFVQPLTGSASSELPYYEMCRFSINYESVMLYGTGPGSAKIQRLRDPR
jgi:hypothetical protein